MLLLLLLLLPLLLVVVAAAVLDLAHVFLLLGGVTGIDPDGGCASAVTA